MLYTRECFPALGHFLIIKPKIDDTGPGLPESVSNRRKVSHTEEKVLVASDGLMIQLKCVIDKKNK